MGGDRGYGIFSPQASTCDAERERLREISRYYCTLQHSIEAPVADTEVEIVSSLHNDDTPEDVQPPAAFLSKDIALTSFTQLGVYKLDCNRAFISIIDGNSQHFIAEATKSISLRHENIHAPDDGIYLGTRSLDLKLGVCPFIMPLFTGQDPSLAMETPNVVANQTRYVVHDFTKEESFKEQPYVLEWPYFRFYAEVPLFSPSGHVLGSYCVVDDKPREEFNEHHFNSLREIADAISDHLENVRIAYFHYRAERLVKGLTTFVKDGKGFNPQEVASHNRLRSITRPSLSRNTPITPAKLSPESKSPEISDKRKDSSITDATRSSATSLLEDSSPFLSERSSDPTEPSSLGSISDINSTMPGNDQLPEDKLSSGETTVPPTPIASQDSPTDNMPMSERMNMIFTRASILLQESLDLDGVAFLDAGQNPMPSFFSPAQGEELNTHSASVTPEFPTAPCPSPLALSNPLTDPLETPCKVLGSAMRDTQTQGIAPTGEFVIAQALLNMFVSLFPHGQVFNFAGEENATDYLLEGDGNLSSMSTAKNIEKASREISRLLPEAKSALFFPLWDYTKSRWMAGTLIWTKHSRQALGVEELHYFKVFGNSIISEISRAHWASVEKSKFDFISSVSHELRSPLHGILASAELLNGTELSPPQKEMIKMVESSGLTLLDTMDHLLDFCKINSLAKVKRWKNFSRNDSSILVSGFDLGHLVEEVTNILYTGQRAPATSARMVNRFPVNTAAKQSIDPSADSEEISVIVRIEQNHHWEIQSQAGAWRRIVMNLLGNAIKWTKAGFVEVSLSHSHSQTNPQTLLAHLTITDTGCGIEPEFLRHKLFIPFTQENSLDEGVGLGLSIVRQLVASLGGYINVQSELEVGTQVDVHIPVQYLQRSPSQSSAEPVSGSLESTSIPLQACLVGFNGYPDLEDPPTGMLSVEAKRKLSIQSTLADVFLTQAGWSVSLVESLDKANGDVVVIEESALGAFTGNDGSFEKILSHLSVRAFIVLGSKVSVFNQTDNSRFIWVAQPFGPRRILDAFHHILKIIKENPNSDPKSLPGLSGHSTEPAPRASPVQDTENDEIGPNEHENDKNENVEKPAVAELPPEDSKVPAKTPLKATPVKGRDWHVLIVDDSTINLKIMATFMRKLGCTYDTANNGLIALEKYIRAEKAYNLVLMDISMPVMDGLESTSKIRLHEKETGKVSSCIMAVTGVASDTMQQQALAAGINDYLIKPLSFQELKKVMKLE